MVRVLCEAIDGEMVEGDVIGGDLIGETSEDYDLEGAFTVRCGDGTCFEVHGWLVDVTVLWPPVIQ